MIEEVYGNGMLATKCHNSNLIFLLDPGSFQIFTAKEFFHTGGVFQIIRLSFPGKFFKQVFLMFAKMFG